ncbi:MAG: signal peptidase II [Thermodesulfobacteriota bacterium]
MKKIKRLFLIVTFVVLLDQVTKHIITKLFYLHQSIEVIPGFLNIVYVRNPGAAFGILREANAFLGIPILTIVALIAVVVLFYLYIVEESGFSYGMIGLPLIMAGTIGNLIDRIRMGEVVDFIDIYIKFYHWPAFNVADMSITTGACILLFTLVSRPLSSQSVQ